MASTYKCMRSRVCSSVLQDLATVSQVHIFVNNFAPRVYYYTNNGCGLLFFFFFFFLFQLAYNVDGMKDL